MQTTFVKYSMFILALTAFMTANAQQKKEKQRTYNNIYTIHNDPQGKNRESIKTIRDNIAYQLELVNDTLVELYVDEKLVPADQYGQYAKVIEQIKEQIRLDRIQAKKDQEQATKDQQQAKIDQEHAMKDQANAKLDQEHAAKAQHQAKLDQEMAMKDQANAKLEKERANKDQQQAKLDQEQAAKAQHQAKLDQEMAMKDQANAKLDKEQANKDQKQAKLDQEQAKKDQARAKIDQKQAEEDQQMMKQLIIDLIKDGIVPDEASVNAVELSSTGMTVNDKKQPDEVYKRYKEKYKRFATGNFYYGGSDNSGGKGIHMHRP
jgi:colicin import membrane protein